MRLNVTRREENYIEIEIGGEGHTLLNLLQSTLLQDPDVEMAGYSKSHSLMNKSQLFVTTKEKKDPMEVLKKATKDSQIRLSEFLEQFKSNLPEKE
jgi:DNA-directed RNA polymerase subunit L